MSTLDSGVDLRLVPAEPAFVAADPEALAALRVRALRSTGRRRGWLMRRMLLVADMGALTAAFVGATAVTGTAAAPGALTLLAWLPAWVVAAKLYGLYERDTEWAAFSTTEELAAVLHLLTLAAWAAVVVEWIMGTGP